MDTKNLYGLVLCGGNSSRMGVDKSRLHYHGIQQRFYVHQLLSKFCQHTFISYNAQQATDIDLGYEVIVDDNTFADNGPISGLLSAFQRFPTHDFFVVGCDYPFINNIEISHFLESIPVNSQAAAFYNEECDCYEPVLAWYSHRAGVWLKQYFDEGKTSLQRFLHKHDAFRYVPGNVAAMRSIDSYDKYLQVMKENGRLFNASKE